MRWRASPSAPSDVIANAISSPGVARRSARPCTSYAIPTTRAGLPRSAAIVPVSDDAPWSAIS
jgi:hypothetical protein